ncbi:MAG: theronine dehydrogenase, partial [Acidimicrobiaceae bacterium]|nr:theronine dehydrogenase [Acidimicrobiaceae bacterium]
LLHRDRARARPGALDRSAVLGNRAMFGSVNANRRHYIAGVKALQAADPKWLGRLISRRVPLERYAEALQRQNDDVKVVLELAR